MIVLDTHAFVWLTQDSPKLGRKARRQIAQATLRRDVSVSAISYWELAMLVDAGRLRLPIDLAGLRTSTQRAGISEISMDGEIALVAARLSGLHGDPADRIITATALCRHAVLLTADEKLLNMAKGPKRLDAQS